MFDARRLQVEPGWVCPFQYMCQIEEERFVLVLLDESYRPFGVVGGKPALVGVVACHFVPVKSGKVGEVEHFALLRMEGPHVIGVGKSVIFVKTVLQGKELWMVSQVPFAEDGGAIAFLFQQFA